MTFSSVMRFGRKLPTAAFVAGLLFTPASFAQELTVPAPAAEPAAAAPVGERPARGLTMDAVRSKFGAPTQETPSIGAPPISRWDYPGYAVFFEHDRVLHTVLK